MGVGEDTRPCPEPMSDLSPLLLSLISALITVAAASGVAFTVRHRHGGNNGELA